MVSSPNSILYPRIEVLSKLLTHLDFPKSHRIVHFAKWKMYFRCFQVYIRPILHLNLVLQSWKVMSILSLSLRSIRIPKVQDWILQKSMNISKNMELQMCKADQRNDQVLGNEFGLWLSNRLEDNHLDGKNIFYFFLIYNNFFEWVILADNFSVKTGQIHKNETKLFTPEFTVWPDPCFFKWLHVSLRIHTQKWCYQIEIFRT